MPFSAQNSSSFSGSKMTPATTSPARSSAMEMQKSVAAQPTAVYSPTSVPVEQFIDGIRELAQGLITKQTIPAPARNTRNLNYFDAVIFYTTGDLGLTDQQKKDLLSFVHDDGKGFLGTHSATDTYYNWPEYGELIGGYFNEHPWGQVHCTIRTEDKTFPVTAHFPASFPFYDEIYRPLGCEFEIAMWLPGAALPVSAFALHRARRDFSERERQLLNLARRHVTQPARPRSVR